MAIEPLDAARDALRRGWRPFPVDHPSLATCVGRHGPAMPCNGKRGKHPAVAFGVATATVPPDGMLRSWFNGSPRNVGIACGPSALLVIDEDEADALQRLAASADQTIPVTYRVRTARGWHYYFRMPDGIELGNSAGGLAQHGMDVRGGKGLGGYVVGAGSLHETGVVYTAENPAAPVADLPGWIVELILGQDPLSRDGGAGRAGRAGSAGRNTPGQQVSGTLRNATLGKFDPTTWDDEPRYGTAEGFRTQYARHLAGVTTPGAEFRHELFLAARDGWRLVNCGQLAEDDLLADLAETLPKVWNNPPSEIDQLKFRTIVHHEARDKAAGSPWVVVAESAPDGRDRDDHDPAAGGSGDDSEEATPIPYDLLLAAEVRKERLRRDARAVLAEENRVALEALSATEFLTCATPDYLVAKMLYRDGLACIFGPPGAAKSFLALDLALSLATGMSWQDNDLGRGVAHYVMAEGKATNTLRTLAWLAHHKVDPGELEGRFVAFTTAFLLTEAGVAPYLEYVTRDKPALIIFDTRNLMFAGRESAGEDYGAMLRVLHGVREAAGGAAVVLVDHTGLGDETRARGSNAQKGGIDTEIMVSECDNGVRRVRVTRDKSGVVGAQWGFRLQQVEEVPRPDGITAPAVCVPAVVSEASAMGLFRTEDDWTDPVQVMLPEDVVNYRGAGRAAINALARFMRYSASGGVGFTQVAARRAVRERFVGNDGKPRWSADTIDRAWGALVEMNRLEVWEGGSSTARSRWVAFPDDP